MQAIKKISFILAGVVLLVAACRREPALTTYNRGSAPTLTASANNVAPVAADSDRVVLTINWTNPGYATDSANIKAVVQIDSAGKNFTRPDTRTIMGNSRTASFTARQLNEWLLNRGYAFNAPVDMDIRVITSYANNNDQQTSNTVRVRMTPYRIPPRIPLPASGRLFIVGGATPGGWNNPVPTPAQELTRIDETTFAAILTLSSGSYLFLPVNGDWSDKYGGTGGNNSNNPNGDAFVRGGSDLASPTAAGTYRIVVDFQTGRFSLTPVANALPASLWATGDATAAGWTNTPPASQQFTRLTNGIYELTMPLNATGAYKFLSMSGNWQPQFGGSSATNGVLEANWGGGSDPAAIPAPGVAGNYRIRVDFVSNSNGTGRYTVTRL
jgi:hypothetical protein